MQTPFTHWALGSKRPVGLLTGLLLTSALHSAATAQVVAYQPVAQSPTVNAAPQVATASLKSVLAQWEAEYNVTIVYESSLVGDKRVAVPTGPASLEAQMQAVLPAVNLSFRKLPNGQYVLQANPAAPASSTPPPASVGKARSGASRASYPVSGQVRTAKGEGIPGVTVLVKGTTVGTSTNNEGRFVLDVPEDATALIFSFVGYASQTVALGSQRELTVTLAEDSQALSDVVVVGYGTVRKSDLTGSVASVSERDLRATPLVSIQEGLQGRAAGLVATQTSSAPGGSASIRIRGGNSINGGNEPLYVIDGFPIYNDPNTASTGISGSGQALNPLTTINPNDIESVEVLKDASATSIYGSRGANGVIIITTKRGRAGQSNVAYDAYYGTQRVAKTLPLLNATQYAQFVNETVRNNNPTAPLPFPNPESLGEGTDWQKEIFRVAPMQNHQLSANGGDDKTQYAIAGNYFRQEGIVINSYYQRYNLRVNLDRRLSERFKVGNSLTVTRASANSTTTDTDGGAASGVINSALLIAPTVPVRDASGAYTLRNRDGGTVTNNPVAFANETVNKSLTTRVLGNVYLDFNPLKNLTLRVTGGADLSSIRENYFLPNTVLSGQSLNGVARIGTIQNSIWLNENTLSYNPTLGPDHSLNAVVGFTQQGQQFESATAAARGFSSPLLQFNNLSAGAVGLPPTSGAGEWGLRSYLGRVNYAFKNRYLATLAVRTDGSSRFGPGRKYATFPSGSLAWRLSEEGFFQGMTSTVNDAKLRASYGISGNQEIGNYQPYGIVNPQFTVFNDVFTPGFAVSRVSNPDLRWETTAQLDLGVDLAFFSNRLTLTADYYEKKTSDLLLFLPQPSSSGFTSALQNVGSLQNKGFEFSLGTNVDQGDFRWNSTLTYAANRNKVTDLGPLAQFFSGVGSGNLQIANTGVVRVGEPIGTFFGLQTDGIFQSADEVGGSAQATTAKPGDRRYKDTNGDGVINSNDRVILGNAQPKFSGGFLNTFTYKGFELGVFFSGVYGNKILNLNLFENENLFGAANQLTTVLDRWTTGNPSTTVPRASNVRGANQISDRQVEDGSFLRLKNLSFAYALPASLLSPLKLKAAKVGVSAQNYLTFTKYTGYNPEVGSRGLDNLSQGIDYGSYPLAKTVTFTLNVGF